MKRKFLILLLIGLFSLCGCSNIKNMNTDSLLNELANKTGKYNEVNRAFKYYLPSDLSIDSYDDYNAVFSSANYKYYLYVDLISYYNKKDLKFEKNDNIYYSRLLFKDDKLGVIDVTNDSDECFVKVTYNYATIETKVNLLDLNETISNIMIILSSINYNDAVIKNILTNESKVEDDEVVEVFDNKKNDNSSLDVEEDEYSGNEEEDYDPDVIN